MRRRVLFHVQHLLGIGHLRRVAALARAAAERGLDVTVASGGMPVEGLDMGGARLVQLPALRAADESFTALLDQAGRPIDEAWRLRRRVRLLDLFAEVRPHVLVVEMFPFGRRQLGFELLPLLETARANSPRCRIVSSVRDVLTRRKPGRAVEAAAWARRFLDAVLVHGDPAAIPFGTSFPAAREIEPLLHYTGYVSSGPAGGGGNGGDAGRDEVIVSAGGGAVGEQLLRTALAARRRCGRAAALDWRLLAGANLAADTREALSAAAPAGVTVERARDDFPDILGRCALSLSQGGYNTMVDIVEAGARAIVVPFARGGQTEQALRARRFAELGLVRCIGEDELAPGRLAGEIDAALAGPRPAVSALAMGGAVRSACLIAGWAEAGDG
jgi:predicted glycosyltransferase